MTQATGKTSSILSLVNKTVELPTLPEVLLKLNSLIADPDCSAEAVAQVISADPAVATNILRIVNSAYFGLQVRVSSVSLAVTIMGFAMTKKVALKAAVFSMFSAKNRRAAGDVLYSLNASSSRNPFISVTSWHAPQKPDLLI